MTKKPAADKAALASGGTPWARMGPSRHPGRDFPKHGNSLFLKQLENLGIVNQGA